MFAYWFDPLKSVDYFSKGGTVSEPGMNPVLVRDNQPVGPCEKFSRPPARLRCVGARRGTRTHAGVGGRTYTQVRVRTGA